MAGHDKQKQTAGRLPMGGRPFPAGRRGRALMHYRLANGRDMDALIDFIDMVFSMVRVPHDFEAILPKVYGPGRRRPEIHVIAEDDEGRLCGCLGMMTYPLRVAGRTLRVGYLGSMAVHPRARGQGVMGELLRRQIARAQVLGLDLLALGGQRQRYGFSGFENGGIAFGYSVRQANVRHAMADVDASALTLHDAVEADVPLLHALYDAQIVAGARSEADFLTILGSYGHRTVTVERDGEPVGYLCVSGDGLAVDELVTASPSLILPTVKRYAQQQKAPVLHIAAAPHDVALNRLLAPICESDAITPCCMLRVLRPERVLDAYMRLRNSLVPMESGQLVLGWEGLGAYRLSVEAGETAVEATNLPPDISLPGRAMHSLLFAGNRYAAPETQNALVRSWLPLPVYIPVPDRF